MSSGRIGGPLEGTLLTSSNGNFSRVSDTNCIFNFTHTPRHLDHKQALDQFIAQYPALQSLYLTMKTYITPKILLLLVFSLLLIARGVVSDEKAPPTTLQIGTNPLPPLLSLSTPSSSSDKPTSPRGYLSFLLSCV